MLTPAQRYVQQAVARNRVTMSTRETQRERTAHEQVLHQLRLAQQQLKGVQSNIARAELKKHLMPDFEGWIEGTLAGDCGRQDEVITTMMVWAIDCRDYPLALRIGEYVIRHGLALPDNFGRDATTVLTEEIADVILTQAATNSDTDLSGYTAMLDTLHGLVHDKDMPDQVRAKLHKARAFSRRTSTYPDDIHQSLMLLREAMRLNPAAGVKRDIATLERAVKKLSSPPPEPVKKDTTTARKTGNSKKASAKKKLSTGKTKNTH
ncbi:terminase [Escherichia coli]|uniref:phage terminase small subunit n=1 Tax=Escherichia coli TaxID=562 RepID=UPI002FC77D3B|nr:terminase [Escherichia coli]